MKSVSNEHRDSSSVWINRNFMNVHSRALNVYGTETRPRQETATEAHWMSSSGKRA